MGLCKCPKKKVTNLFCFEHRVNVCEHCLVANHSKCIVQSYLQWLQDSDYKPDCSICDNKLQDEQHGDCVRLMCYDVFHWQCLDAMARQLPATTAPAGYECPTCKKPIIPRPNHAGPVADALKERLVAVNWARPGLGMSPVAGEDTTPNGTPAGFTKMSPSGEEGPSTVTSVPQRSEQAVPQALPVYPSTQQKEQQSVLLNMVPESNAEFYSGSRKGHDSRGAPYTPNSFPNQSSVDYDEDKYKRRPAFSWLARWFRNHFPSRNRRDPKRRMVMMIVLGLLAFLTLILIMARVGRQVADKDPFLNPDLNPNIVVRDQGPDDAFMAPGAVDEGQAPHNPAAGFAAPAVKL